MEPKFFSNRSVWHAQKPRATGASVPTSTLKASSATTENVHATTTMKSKMLELGAKYFVPSPINVVVIALKSAFHFADEMLQSFG